MSRYDISMMIRAAVSPAVASGDDLAVDVDISADGLGEQTFASALPALDFSFLDALEDFIQDGPASPADIDRVGEQQGTIANVGQVLFERTLGAWGQWATLLAQARAAGATLRIVLRSPSPATAALPWELMRDASGSGYLALEPGVTIVRNPQRLGPVPQMAATRPLRVLMCGSTPSDLRQIDVPGELRLLNSVLNGLGGSVEPYLLTRDPSVCTFDQLRTALEHQGPWHIIHFSGHGGYEAAVGGLLAFTTPQGRVDSIPAAQIGSLLASHPSLRLVVLNACRGAMGVGRQVTDSVAGALVHRGVPACVSMQFEVTDRAALPFADHFYRGIVEHGDVDRAVAEARRAISEVSLYPGHPVGSALRSTEWATPVLHLESVGSQLFPPSAPGPPAAPAAGEAPLVAQPEVAAPVRHQGTLESVSRMHWRLTYATELDVANALQRVGQAVQAATDVRKTTPTSDGFVALAGGVFPGAWSATERIMVQASARPGGATVSVASQPNQGTLLDQGRNRALVERIASYLGVEVG